VGTREVERTQFSQQDIDEIVAECGGSDKDAVQAYVRDGGLLLTNHQRSTKVAWITKVSELGVGFILQWRGVTTDKPIGTQQWYASAKAAAQAAVAEFRIQEAQWRLGAW